MAAEPGHETLEQSILIVHKKKDVKKKNIKIIVDGCAGLKISKNN